MGEEESFEVLAEVPPGVILTIEQAVGYCNDNTVKTELFKITHALKNGTILSTHYERAKVGKKQKVKALKTLTYISDFASNAELFGSYFLEMEWAF